MNQGYIGSAYQRQSGAKYTNHSKFYPMKTK